MIRCKSVWLAVVLVMSGGLALLLAQNEAPPQTRQLRANGVDLSYVEQGKGAPVVFVHGAVGDLRLWEPQRQAVASRHRFIAYTYRYHGAAPWPDEGKDYAAATHAADLAAFISGLNAGPVHLVGLSYGGVLAALVASEHPQLVRSLTLAEPALFSLLAEAPETRPALDAFNKEVEGVAAVLKAGDLMGATKLFYELVTGEGAGSFDKQPETVRRIIQDNARTLPFLFAGPLPAISCDALRAVKMPTLVVGGEQTPTYFALINQAVVRCVAGSRLVTIPKANHVMSYQNPAAFNEALLQFLAQP